LTQWKKTTYHMDQKYRGRRGRDRMAVGFTTTDAISTHHH